jgi:hypothetical protein
MAKFVITEEQFNLIKKELSEDVKDVKDDRYQRSIKVDVDTYDATINGETIDWAVSDKIQLSYLIDVEFKSWGIKDINLYDIQGPSEIEVVITPQVEDAEDVVVTVSCDWENIEIETEKGIGLVTVGDEITLKLGNNENGDLICQGIVVPVYSL